MDDKLYYENAVTVLKSSAEKYPCYYVSGNHEYWSGEIDTIKQMIAGYGIEVLEGQSETVLILKAEDQADPAMFTVFMTHRPEYINTYLQYDFDLILSGHAHGGQWRIPGIMNGLLSPN